MTRHRLPHPTLPFISVEEHRNAEIGQVSPNHWCFLIEDLCESGIHRSYADALEAAEKEFLRHTEFAESKLRTALDGGDVEVALSIAHLRGFWEGSAKHRATIARNVKRAIDSLEPLLR